MKISEWLKIVKVIRTRWPHADLPEATVEQWGTDMADLDAEAVLAVIETMYREGREFPPHGGQIRKRLAELTLDAPDWGWVLRELSTVSALPDRWIDSTKATKEDPLGHAYPRRERLEDSHPLVVSFVSHVGWDQVTAAFNSGSDEARLRDKWKQFTARAEQQVAFTGISAPESLRTLTRVAGGPAHSTLRRGSGVTDALRQLEAGRGRDGDDDDAVDAEVVDG